MPAPRGNDYANGNPGGSPPSGNQNAQRHGLFSERSGYYADLSDGEQDWINSFTRSLFDRYRRFHDGNEPSEFDETALKNIAIDLHRIAHSNSWVSEHGLVHESEMDISSGSGVQVNLWISEIRKHNESIYRRMDKHGLLDSSDKQAADARADMQMSVTVNHE